MLCYEMSMLWYAMVNVVKDTHDLTVILGPQVGFKVNVETYKEHI